MLASVQRLFRHLVVYGSADAAALVINTFLLPVFTRVLSLQEYGVLALVLVLEAFLKVLFRWGLDTSFLRLHYDVKDPDRQRTLAGTATMLLVAADGVLLAWLWVASPWIATQLFGTASEAWVLRMLALNMFVSTFHFLPLTQLRIEERSRTVAAWSMVRSFGTIVARLIFVVGFRWSVLGFMVADLVVSLILFVGLWPTLRRMTAWAFSWTAARELLVVGLPRVPHGLLHQVTAMADRFLLGMYLSLEQLGLYSIAATVASTLKLYPVALTTAWTPLAFEAMRRPDAPVFYARTATYAFTVLAALSTALVLVGSPLVRLLTPEPYHPAAALVPLLVLGVAIQACANFVSTALQIAKHMVPFPIITLVAAVVSVAANVLLIPVFGTQGAALASAIAQLALLIATWWFAHHSYPIPYERGRLARITGVAVAVSLAGMLVREMTGQLAADVVNVLLLAAFPAGLLAVRVFRPTETASLRAWLRSLLRSAASGSNPG
ncbi:MAG TPA: oligosaccharide flippase family protein [Vicinamibacterales bacterium]|nr:oligosaccharide flippase family protein [Vicinamibacterales bacterium]